MATYKIILVRHGESTSNKNNLFCGWYNADLTDKGKQEASQAGKYLKKDGYTFDIAYTSVLTRAEKTLRAILAEIEQPDIPVIKTWQLNERHFGALTGLSKPEAVKKHGEKLMTLWRRSFSFDVPLPPMEPNHPHYENIIKKSRYVDGPAQEEFPKFETLKMTVERTLQFWNNSIVPQIRSGKRIIIASHENPLRGIIQHLDQMNDEQIMQVSVPNGTPFVYILDENLKPVKGLEFLGNFKTI